jgi:hypothetical protein
MSRRHVTTLIAIVDMIGLVPKLLCLPPWGSVHYFHLLFFKISSKIFIKLNGPEARYY